VTKKNPAAFVSALFVCLVFCSCGGNVVLKSELPPQMPKAQEENLADPYVEEAVNDYMNAQGPYEETYVSDDRFIEHTWMGFDELLTSELNTFTEELINSLP
jgi:hypothetical protein